MAQFGSALEWGSRGRKFESSYPDQKKPLKALYKKVVGGFLFVM